MSDKLPLRDAEPTLQLIRELRDAEQLTEELMALALTERRTELVRLEPAPSQTTWDDLQIVTAQLATKPLLENVPVGTELELGLASNTRRQTLDSRLLVQLGPIEDEGIGWLTIDEDGLQVLSSSAGADPGRVRAMYVDQHASRAHRERIRTSGIPAGLRMSEYDVARNVDYALSVGADFILLDAGAHTIQALAEARGHLAKVGVPQGFAILLAGDTRVPADFIKALALGADAVVVASSTTAQILAIASEDGRTRVRTFVRNSILLMKVMTRACGHNHFKQFRISDLTTWRHHAAEVSGVKYSGLGFADSSLRPGKA
jgi:hypothetical protein